MDLLGQCSQDPECKAVLVTGIGGTFSHGLDLSLLAYDGAAEKQRKSAEALASTVRKLVRCLTDYPKVLVAAVNGFAHGLGVALLPLFDLVFASDKATFSTSYVQLQQIPEAFANHTVFQNTKVCKKLCLMQFQVTHSEDFHFSSQQLCWGRNCEKKWPKRIPPWVSIGEGSGGADPHWSFFGFFSE